MGWQACTRPAWSTGSAITCSPRERPPASTRSSFESGGRKRGGRKETRREETPRKRVLADSFEQLSGGGELEAASENHDRLESRRALATLQQAYLGSMQVAYVGKRLLGESDAPAMATQVGGELLSYGLHGQHCRWPQTEGLQTKVGARSL